MALDLKAKETIREEGLRLSKEFSELDGRRPRLLLLELEDDSSADREKRKQAANAFADSGWDVDIGPLQSPEDAARSAADNDVHFLFYSSSSSGRVKLGIQLAQGLTLYGRDDILIAIHQVKEEEKGALFRYGIICAFDEEYDYLQASLTMLRILIAREKEEAETADSY